MVQDYRINAEARRLLTSRWIDVSLLQVGTTNGVIYILGRLDTTMEDPHKREERRRVAAADRLVTLVASLEKDLRRLRDVRDVVLKLDNVTKRGGRWRAADGTASERRVIPGAPLTVRSRGDRHVHEVNIQNDDDREGEVRS